MALNLDPEAAHARDLAKRCVPEGWELSVEILIPALIHGTDLKDKFPQLARYIPPPCEVREDTPVEVPVAKHLKPVLQELAAAGDQALSPEGWLAALLQSSPGRNYTIRGGVPDEELEQTLAFLTGMALARAASRSSSTPEWRGSQQRQEVVEALATFGRMLTAVESPEQGLVGFDRPLRSLLRALVKRKQRSAVVIGQPGTGKSALVYELACRMVRGDPSIPEGLRGYDIFELSPIFLRSGMSLVGQYEERLGSILRLLRDNPKVILFVDELHSMFQSGIHERGPFTDANEAFKQAIAQGDISLIGCTTTAEYRHHIEPDQALAQRFSIVNLEPPSPEKTREILRARRREVEEFYHLQVPEAVLDKIVELSEEYLPARAQPRKSIQLLDEGCAFCVTQESPGTQLTEDIVWSALEDTVGHSLIREETLTESGLFEELRSKIVGQDDTLRSIAQAFVSGLGGWGSKRNAPRGIFLFCGPTGVGKTETAVLLSRILGSGREAMVRVDCNTLQGFGGDAGPALHVLLGPPPGYLGYVRGKGGVLSRIRDTPEGIVLFDEIEKADPAVGKVLLQIMDDGRCEDHDGNLLDFRRSFIVFTTNAGVVYDRQRPVGFGKEEALPEPNADLDAVKTQIRAMGLGEEFLGRITHFFLFHGLQRHSVRVVLDTQLEDVRKTARERGFQLGWGEDVPDHLMSYWQPRFGIRHLVAILRNRVIEQLSVADAQGELKGVGKIRLEVLDTRGRGKMEDLTGLAVRSREDGTLVIGLA